MYNLSKRGYQQDKDEFTALFQEMREEAISVGPPTHFLEPTPLMNAVKRIKPGRARSTDGVSMRALRNIPSRFASLFHDSEDHWLGQVDTITKSGKGKYEGRMLEQRVARRPIVPKLVAGGSGVAIDSRHKILYTAAQRVKEIISLMAEGKWPLADGQIE